MQMYVVCNQAYWHGMVQLVHHELNMQEVVECDRCRLFVWRDNLAAHQQTGGCVRSPLGDVKAHEQCRLLAD